MKKVVCLFFVGFLLQSCMTYVPVANVSGLKEKQYYKIQRGNKIIHAKLLKINTTTIVVRHHWKKQTLVIPDIQGMQHLHVRSFHEVINLPSDFITALSEIPMM